MNTNASPQPGERVSSDELARKLVFSAVSQSMPSDKRKEDEEMGTMDKSYTLSLLLASLLRR